MILHVYTPLTLAKTPSICGFGEQIGVSRLAIDQCIQEEHKAPEYECQLRAKEAPKHAVVPVACTVSNVIA